MRVRTVVVTLVILAVIAFVLLNIAPAIISGFIGGHPGSPR